MRSFCSISNGGRNCRTRAIVIPTLAKREPPLFSPRLCPPPVFLLSRPGANRLLSDYRCGEHFPRGRLDSLTSHLTKKCPAISEAERVNALLTLSGMSHASQRFQQSQAAQAQAQARAEANGSSVDLPMMQRDWTALGVLAEVSRQIDLNEKNDDRGQPNGAAPPLSAAPPDGQPLERFDLQEQFTMENAVPNQENASLQPVKGRSTHEI